MTPGQLASYERHLRIGGNLSKAQGEQIIAALRAEWRLREALEIVARDALRETYMEEYIDVELSERVAVELAKVSS